MNDNKDKHVTGDTYIVRKGSASLFLLLGTYLPPGAAAAKVIYWPHYLTDGKGARCPRLNAALLDKIERNGGSVATTATILAPLDVNGLVRWRFESGEEVETRAGDGAAVDEMIARVLLAANRRHCRERGITPRTIPTPPNEANASEEQIAARAPAAAAALARNLAEPRHPDIEFRDDSAEPPPPAPAAAPTPTTPPTTPPPAAAPRLPDPDTF